MTTFCVREITTGRLIRDDRGQVFKAIDRGVADAVIEKLRRDGADTKTLEVFEIAPPPQTGRNI